MVSISYRVTQLMKYLPERVDEKRTDTEVMEHNWQVFVDLKNVFLEGYMSAAIKHMCFSNNEISVICFDKNGFQPLRYIFSR